eukprot:5634933-Pyramimonas_sp.AAC.1
MVKSLQKLRVGTVIETDGISQTILNGLKFGIIFACFPPRETTSGGRQLYDRGTEHLLKWIPEVMATIRERGA